MVYFIIQNYNNYDNITFISEKLQVTIQSSLTGMRSLFLITAPFLVLLPVDRYLTGPF